MKKIFLIFIFSLIFWYQVYAEKNCNSEQDIYKQYQCYEKEVCEKEFRNPKEKNPNDNKIHYQTKKYKNALEYENTTEEENKNPLLRVEREEKAFKKAVLNYKENMNNIYKCSLLATQYNSLRKVKDKLKKNKEVKENIVDKIDEYLKKIEIKMNSWETQCKNIDKKESYQKLIVLREVTFETCKYRYYLEYLKDYYNQSITFVRDDEETKKNWESVKYIEKKVFWIQNAISKEIEASYKIFPIAYARYSEYENNFPIHVLLLIIKEDYIVLRKNLHSVLNPLNQVVYKISNAMSK